MPDLIALLVGAFIGGSFGFVLAVWGFDKHFWLIPKNPPGLTDPRRTWKPPSD